MSGPGKAPSLSSPPASPGRGGLLRGGTGLPGLWDTWRPFIERPDGSVGSQGLQSVREEGAELGRALSLKGQDAHLPHRVSLDLSALQA